MRSSSGFRIRLYSSCLIAALVTVSCASSEMRPAAMSGVGIQRADFDKVIGQHARTMLDEGRQTFRFDTFGSEAFWGGALQLHRAIAGAKLGGVGPGFYHDGRFATLRDVVHHYDGVLRLGLTEQEKNDLVQHLLGL